MYKTERWKNKRSVILRRDDYLCQESKRYGVSVLASTVHHIYPVEEYPELAYTNWNLISLCEAKHNSMHDRVTNELTALGKQWQEKKRVEFEKWKKEKEGNTPRG